MINLNRVYFPKPKTYTLKELQDIYDSFDKDSKPTGQGLINYLKNERKSA